MKERIIQIVTALTGSEELVFDIVLDEFTINSIETIPELKFNVWGPDDHELGIEFNQLKYTQIISIIKQLEELF